MLQAVIIHSVSNICAQVLFMNVNGLRQDREEVDVPAKDFRETSTWGRVAL